MITPFLIRTISGKYIFLKDKKIELYDEFPFNAKDLSIYCESDKYREAVIATRLNIISQIFVDSFSILNRKEEVISLLKNGSSSILRIIIDCNALDNLQDLCENIIVLKDLIIQLRKINYGFIHFFLLVDKHFYNINDLITEYNDITFILKCHDYEIINNNFACNWITCTTTNNIIKINNSNDANYIFDMYELLLTGDADEIASIVYTLHKLFSKQKTRLFPMVLDRLLWNYNLDSFCSCKDGKNICSICCGASSYSCKWGGSMQSKSFCMNCELKGLCGECGIGDEANNECIIHKVFYTYYSRILGCTL